MKPYHLLIISIFVGMAFLSYHDNFTATKNYLASVFFTKSTTVAALAQKFHSQQKIKILIVPGHEPDFGGAEYGDRKERDMTVELASEIAKYFKGDDRFEVVLTRDQSGWNPEIKGYLDAHTDDIVRFVQLKKAEMERLVHDGSVVKVSNKDKVRHATAPTDVALRLFGINKWANEHGVDVTIHIHFNDYPRKKQSLPGDYHGFAVYVPDYQYSNAEVTGVFAQDLFARLKQRLSVSNLPKEDMGIVGDQDLIAIGQSNTVEGVSVLIEYGYIYEPQFATAESRAQVFHTMAEQTYLGAQDFFK